MQNILTGSNINLNVDLRIGNDYTAGNVSVSGLLSQDKIYEALQMLNEQGKDVVVISARYNNLKRSEIMGTLSRAEINLEKNQIINSIQLLMQEGTVSKPPIVSTVNYWIIGTVNYQDPQAFQNFVKKERNGVASEYNECIQFGTAVLSYMKDKFDERTFNAEFSALRYAVEDLTARQTLERMQSVIREVQKHYNLILRFLKKEVKETSLERLYNDAKDDQGQSFLEKYENFLQKYLEINATADSKIYDKWVYDKNEFLEDAGDNQQDLYYKSQLQGLRTKWLRKYNP